LRERKLPNRTAEEEAAFRNGWLRILRAQTSYEVCESFSKIPRFLTRFPPDITLQAFGDAITRNADEFVVNSRTLRRENWLDGTAVGPCGGCPQELPQRIAIGFFT
jgi:hypothetical protein